MTKPILEDLLDLTPGVEDSIRCPACNGEPIPLGKLESLSHHRCRDCGWDFSVTEVLS